MNGAPDNFFVDTNVLVYYFDRMEMAKHRRAQQWVEPLWANKSGRLSWQVLHELYATAIRKAVVPVRDARAAVEAFVQWRPAALGLATLRRAWHWMDQAQLHYWDALVLAAAEQSECRWLLSEDFQAGRKFDTVTVINPFERAPEEFGLA
jgi:predicted nucleic acid-binding protein